MTETITQTPVRLDAIQVVDTSVFGGFMRDITEFAGRIDGFASVIESVRSDTDGFMATADELTARQADVSAGIRTMQDTIALVAASVVDVSAYAHALATADGQADRYYVDTQDASLKSYTDGRLDAFDGRLRSHEQACRQEIRDVSQGLHEHVEQALQTAREYAAGEAGAAERNMDNKFEAQKQYIDAADASLKSYIDRSIQGFTPAADPYDDTALRQSISDVSAYAHGLQIPVIPQNVSAFTNDAGYLTQHQSLEGLATVQALQDVSVFAHSIQVPEMPEPYDDTAVRQSVSDVSAYAHGLVIPAVPQNVSAFTNDAGYLTQHQSLEGLATVQSVSDVSAYAHGLVIPTVDVEKSYVDAQDASLKSYIDNEVGGAIEQVLNDVSLNGFATKNYVDSAIQAIPAAEPYDDTSVRAEIGDVSAYAHGLVIPAAYDDTSVRQSVSDVSAFAHGLVIPTVDVDRSYVDAQDASLKSYVDGEIGDPLSQILNDSSLGGFATRAYVDAALANFTPASQYDDTGLRNALTDVSAYAHGLVIPTKLGDLTDDKGYATQNDLKEYLKADAFKPSDYAAAAALNDVSAYAHGLVIPVIPQNVSAFNNDAGYLDASTLDASFLDPVIEKFGDTDTVLDEILTGSVSIIDASLLEILGQDVSSGGQDSSSGGQDSSSGGESGGQGESGGGTELDGDEWNDPGFE